MVRSTFFQNTYNLYGNIDYMPYQSISLTIHQRYNNPAFLVVRSRPGYCCPWSWLRTQRPDHMSVRTPSQSDPKHSLLQPHQHSCWKVVSPFCSSSLRQACITILASVEKSDSLCPFTAAKVKTVASLKPATLCLEILVWALTSTWRWLTTANVSGLKCCLELVSVGLHRPRKKE